MAARAWSPTKSSLGCVIASSTARIDSPPSSEQPPVSRARAEPPQRRMRITSPEEFRSCTLDARRGETLQCVMATRAATGLRHHSRGAAGQHAGHDALRVRLRT